MDSWDRKTLEEVIEDPEGVKRLGHHALYLGAESRARRVWHVYLYIYIIYNIYIYIYYIYTYIIIYR